MDTDYPVFLVYAFWKCGDYYPQREKRVCDAEGMNDADIHECYEIITLVIRGGLFRVIPSINCADKVPINDRSMMSYQLH